MSTMRPVSSPEAPIAPVTDPASARAGFGPTLALTVTLAVAAFLILMSLVLLVVHPDAQSLGTFAPLIKQNQKAKTLLYVVAFLGLLPVAILAVPRLADAIAARNGAGLPFLASTLTGTLALVVLAVSASSGLPWGDGLKPVLAGVAGWWLAAGVVLKRAARPVPWLALRRLESSARPAALVAGVLVFGTVLSVTSRASLHVLPLALGGLLAIGVLVARAQTRRRITLPAVGRRGAIALEALVVVFLAFAIPNVVIFHTTSSVPSIYFPPGVYQNQQDYLLGSVNQLLGGGALLVNVPVSQYGVGLVYFVAGWFHLAPIGYGTAGFLDGLLTVLFYLAGYSVLRIAGVGRLLAAGTVTVGVVGLLYGLRYPVGALPETGPLRFGLPMALVLARVIAARWPRHARAADTASFCIIGLAAIWAFEAFAYTIVAFAAIIGASAWLAPAAGRRRWLLRQVVLALVACLIAHLALAIATVAGTGHWPDWGDYLAYLRSFLFGGRAGEISYGFARWSPGLAVAGAALTSSAALLLLCRRLPQALRASPVTLVALAGLTGYAVALLSYTDNRSSTYLLPYVTLPLVLCAAVWLALLLRSSAPRPGFTATAGLAFGIAVATVVVSAAWPLAGGNLSETALAHAYPGGGLRRSLHRLWHPPPIDPRALAGERLLHRYMPAKRVVVLLPTFPDLGIEILMRSRRSNALFIADPVDDSLVFDTWKSRLTADLARLHAGQRVLIDRAALAVIAGLRAHPSVDPLNSQILGGDREVEWVLRELDRRFRIVPVVRDPSGLIVAELRPRAGGT